MDENNSIQLFEDRKIRTAWDEEQEEWYFSVVDVIAVLTDSSNPTDYLKKMRKRDEQLASYLGTNCPQVAMMGATGKKRKVLAATAEQLLRIIQSIPSPKAEPFKLWLAQVGRERIEETIDPEQAIDRALETYQKKGYDTDWIHQRLLSIRVRNELTAEWQERGVQQGKEYAILTDEITKAWSGMTTRQYKKLKGLKKENLRDNMSTMEIVLNMLAEATTTELSKAHQPEGFSESQKIARRGGSYAGQVRQDIEKDTGRPVITSQNAVNTFFTDMVILPPAVLTQEKCPFQPPFLASAHRQSCSGTSRPGFLPSGGLCSAHSRLASSNRSRMEGFSGFVCSACSCAFSSSSPRLPLLITPSIMP